MTNLDKSITNLNKCGAGRACQVDLHHKDVIACVCQCLARLQIDSPQQRVARPERLQFQALLARLQHKVPALCLLCSSVAHCVSVSLLSSHICMSAHNQYFWLCMQLQVDSAQQGVARFAGVASSAEFLPIRAQPSGRPPHPVRPH